MKLSAERPTLYQIFVDDAPAEEVLGDDPLQDGRITGSVPCPLGINHGDRPTFADAQAVRLGAQDPALLGQLKLFEAALEEIPRDEAAILVAALRRGLVAAEENVSPRSRNTDAGGDSPLGVGQARSP